MKLVRNLLAILLVFAVVISGWALSTSPVARLSQDTPTIYLASGPYDPPILPPPTGDTNSIPNTGA